MKNLPFNPHTEGEKQKFFFGISGLIIIYFLLIWLFPTLRILAVGAQQMETSREILVTIIPDIFAIVILVPVIVYFINKKIKITLFDKLFIGYWLSNVILGFILAGDLTLSLRGFRLTYFPMLFYFAGRIFIDNKQQFHTMLSRVMSIFVLAAVAGVIIYFLFMDVQLYMIGLTGNPVSQYFIIRMTSILWTPVVFGFLMSLGAFYSFYKVNTSQPQLLYYILLSLFWVCMVLAVARGPMLAFIISFLLLSLVYRNFRPFIISLLILVTSTLLLYFFYLQTPAILFWVLESTSNTVVMNENVSRVFLWNESIKDFLERPWGYGLGKAGDTAYRFLRDTDIPSAPWTTDGWYLKIACETGIYGLLSYLAVFGIFAMKMIKKIFLKKETSLTLGFGFFIMISANAVVNNCLDFYPYITIYWIIIGYCSNFLHKQQNNESIG